MGKNVKEPRSLCIVAGTQRNKLTKTSRHVSGGMGANQRGGRSDDSRAKQFDRI